MSSLSSTIRLKVTGPPSILKNGPLIREANLGHTWAQFLREDCGLQVSKEEGVIIRNLYPLRGFKGKHQGWMAELDEEISEFVSKFELLKGQYTVRVTKKSWIKSWNDVPGNDQDNVSEDRMDLEEGEVVMPAGPAVNFGSRSVKTEETGACGGDEEETEEGDQLTINNVRSLLVDASDLDIEQLLELNNEEDEQESISEVLEEEEEDIEQMVEEDDFEGVEEEDPEEIKVEQESIAEQKRDEDLLKELVAHNVGRYSNTFMMRVKRELQTLQGSNQWARNVTRSPLSCYLIQALFQD